MIEKIEEATPLNISQKEAFEIGEVYSIRLNHKVGEDIHKLINSRRMNGRIIYDENTDIPRKDQIYLEVHERIKRVPDFMIFITQHESIHDNLCLARGLGHYALHSLMGKKLIQVPRYGQGQLEAEADNFARGFLMPQTQFRRDVDRGVTIDDLATKYGVRTEDASRQIQFLENI